MLQTEMDRARKKITETRKKTDEIIVLKNGKIIESGSYNQLIKNKGYFYDLYKRQSNK